MDQEIPDRAERGSFRDPGGRLFRHGDRILRFVNQAGLSDLGCYLESRTITKLMAQGSAISARILDDAERIALGSDLRLAAPAAECAAAVEHELIRFPSYPQEWPAEMLHAAGTQTIHIAEELLKEGMGLKDATPTNVLFRGPNPVFVDALSVERRTAGDRRWLPYAQFVRTFILPLMVNRDFGISLAHVFQTRRDGMEPEEVYPLLGPLKRFTPLYFNHVTMPRFLGGRLQGKDEAALYEQTFDPKPERADFIVSRLLRSLRKTMEKLAPRPDRASRWTGYMTEGKSYSEEAFRAKEEFVREALKDIRPARVLDVGANNGHFSAMAARAGASVVAIDYDAVVAGEIWQMAREERLDILPLVVDLTRPTPASGWRNSETASFLDRARGASDMILMLAVLHHMIVSERIPVDEVMEMASELTEDAAVVEYVGPGDAMFRRIARGRDKLHEGLSEGVFEERANFFFRVERRLKLPGAERTMYLLRKRSR